MSFVDGSFPLFLAVVLGVYWLLPTRRLQNVLLVVASAVFYGWVHPWFLFLLYGSTLLDFFCAQGMERQPEHRKKLLLCSLAGNLGLLGVFKYLDFFLENVGAVLESLGLGASPATLGIFLPVGISFYTFQTMGYTIDVYRGKVEARRNLLDYAVYVSFFPQLVAGPVERAGNLLPQVEAPRHFDGEGFRSGLTLALWGAFKKIAIADVLAPYVDSVFVLADPSRPLLAAATVGFSLQILADFSGYTDMARGVARMLGFELMVNFRHPYLAKNPSDFWRRWHISFSTWIRDYLYIPLGGSRGGARKTLQATAIALLLSGLWHGASWNFVLWGAYHTLLIAAYRLATPRIPSAIKSAPGAGLAAVGLMYAFTCLGWLIFREVHADRLVGYLSAPGASADQWVATVVLLGVCVAAALPLWVGMWVENQLPSWREKSRNLPLQTTAWSALAVAIFLMVRVEARDFIYFRF